MDEKDYEKLGVFYLGREYDIERQQPREKLLLYDSKDLTTHGVIVGMTGSGKTGLAVTLLEEAAIDGIPAIAIDPKGDLGNLLLTFPNLQAADFQPWVDPADASRKGITPQELSRQTADLWNTGLEKWGQSGARVKKFRDAVETAIYTPASNAGIPLTVLRSFAAPPAEMRDDQEALRDHTQAAVSGLLTLLGIEADPLRSREHILLSKLFETAWADGREVELGSLVRDIQKPPFDKVGFLDLESFFPVKERFELSMLLNNLLASPGFAAWMQGEPLDIQRLLYTDAGKPKLSIVSIAHLTDAERMFFVTILLNEMVAWMRRQSGTSSLRALLYMDEIFGYFPPTANPPSKLPMLTLLKQARAFGVGTVLATQNPVDLDYKGLSNTGTWFIGRLQTERDKARVLDGLEGASAAAGASFNRRQMETIMSGLGNRVFLMNNVHEDAPEVFQTRWSLSYLRGPLTKRQIEGLMQPIKALRADGAGSGAKSQGAPPMAGAAGQRPVLQPGVSEAFVALRKVPPTGSSVVYHPGLVGDARAHFVQAANKIDSWRDCRLLATVSETLAAEVWAEAKSLEEALDFDDGPVAGASFAQPPGELTRPKTYSQLSSALKDQIYRGERLTLWKCDAIGEVSRPDESEAEFRIRLTQEAREQRDLALEKLRAKFAPKLAALDEQHRKALQRVDREKAQAKEKSMSAAISFGATILGALLGRKMASMTNINKAATSVRSATRAAGEMADIGRAQDSAQSLADRMTELGRQAEEEKSKLQEQFEPDKLRLESLDLQPRKADITIACVTLAWLPWIVNSSGAAQPAYE